MARINSSVWLARPIKKELHLSEELHPILLHHDKMCRFADLDEPLVRAAREFVEDSLRALAGSHLIPLSGDHQRWNLDPPGIAPGDSASNQGDRWLERPPTTLRTS